MSDQVEESDRRVRYEVTNPAGQSVFSIPFPISKVYDRDGEEVSPVSVYIDGEKTENYTVNFDTLSAVLSPNAPDDAIVTIEGSRLVKRTRGYPLRGGLKSALINFDFNAVIEFLQEMRRDVGRSFILNKAEGNNISAVMPLHVSGRYIRWGDNGIENGANGLDIENAQQYAEQGLEYRDTTSEFKDAAEAARNKAQKWADEAEDVTVETGKYSAKHWAAKALSVVGNVLTAAGNITDNMIVMGAGGTRAVDVNATGNRIVKGWFTDIEVTNAPSVNGTGTLINSDPTGATGADKVSNVVSLTTAEYGALTPVATTLYIITDA